MTTPPPSSFSHLDDARAAFGRFFESDIARVFVLKGPYGSGKSYFLREEILRGEGVKKQFPFLSYTSVFGLSDLKELTSAAIGSLEFRGSSRGLKKVSGKGMDFVLKLVQKGVKGAIGINPEVSALSLLWSLAHQRGLLLVIDDIDRRDEAKFKLTSIIGFANSLVEHTGGKVRAILVLNEDQLGPDDLKIWQSQREKFIDAEYRFEPRPKELAEAFVDDPGLRPVIGRIHEALDSPNIRTMRKAASLVSEATKYLKAEEVSLIREEQEHAARLASLYLSAGADYPVDLLTDGRPSWITVWAGMDDHHSEEFKKLSERAGMIGFTPYAPLDEVLLQFYTDGRIRPEDLRTFRENRVSEEAIKNFRQASNRLWSLFHETFRETSTEFVSTAKTHVEEFSAQLDLRGIGDITRLVAKLDGDSAPLWSIWLEANGAKLKPDQLEGLRKIVPEGALPLLPTLPEKDIHDVDPAPFFNSIINGRNMDQPDDLKLLAKWTKDDWMNWFESTEYGDVLAGIRAVFGLSWPNDDYNKLREILREAVKEQSTKSQINQLRAEQYFKSLIADEPGEAAQEERSQD